MPHAFRASFVFLVLVPLAAIAPAQESAPATRPAEAPIRCIGKASIPGDAHDLSGLLGKLEDGSPADRLGGFGSAIDWTGHGQVYVACSDRGPADGANDFRCRVHTFTIAIDPAAPSPVTAKLQKTTLLSTEDGKQLTGTARAFDKADPFGGLRFDPEGLRVSATGTWYLSDEYGPSVTEFAANGTRLRHFAVPHAFAIAKPSADAKAEINHNAQGRVANRGFEGLALSPDRTTLFALLQSPLIQDGGREGVNIRCLAITIATGATAQYVVPLESVQYGFNELVAVGPKQFLAIERDSRSGADARDKHIVRVDLSAATDVSSVKALPRSGLPAGIVPAAKAPFLDLLDPQFGLAGPGLPEKFEGLTFGPDLADGTHVLVVTTDNDLIATQPSLILAFAVPASRLPGFSVPKPRS